MNGIRKTHRYRFVISLRTLILVMLLCGPIGGWIGPRVHSWLAARWNSPKESVIRKKVIPASDLKNFRWVPLFNPKPKDPTKAVA